MATQAGFCFGVKNALELTESTSQLANERIYTFGPLIHNPQVVNRLAEQGIKSIESLEEVEAGEIIIRSHGVAPDIIDKAVGKGLTIRDATCPFVKKAQQLAKDFAVNGYQIVIFGDPTHPEVKGVVGWADNRALVVENLAGANLLGNYHKICVIAQTTQSPERFQEIIKVLHSKANEVKVCNTICNATRQRQSAAKELAASVDLMIVVGGRNSSNTRKLAQVCTDTGTTTYHVEGTEELQADWFQDITRVGVTGGASTPGWILEEVIKQMNEFKQEEVNKEEVNKEEVNKEEVKQEEVNKKEEQVRVFNRGDIILGTVVQVNEKEILVDVGSKAEGIIPISELSLKEIDSPAEEVNVGDSIEVYVIKAENEEGVPILSKRRADRMKSWEKIEQAYESGLTIEGKAEQEVKGGLLVDLGLKGFLPASLLEIGYVENLSAYVGQVLSCKIIELERGKNKIILSRKAVLEEELGKAKDETLASLTAGQTIKGTVKRITNFGAFVDLGGVDGLLHVSELSWGRVNNPKDVLTEGEELEVYVLGVNKEKGKISLGLKQLTANPWQEAANKYLPEQVVQGKIVRIAPFGAFVELEPGLEGLVHISQLAREHVIKPEDVISVGQEVQVKILDVNPNNERISLSIKEALPEIKDKELAYYNEKNTANSGVTLGELFGEIFKEAKNGQ